MTAEGFVKLIEEMVDIKVHLVLDTQIRVKPELSRLVSQKRATDARRLEQIRAELARLLTH
jgi:hypothetical protein